MRDSLKNANSEAKQYRLKAKELQEKLESIEAERAENERKLMEEQGEYKKLYESLATEKALLQSQINELMPIAETYKKSIEERRSALLSKLPDDLKVVGEKLAVEDLELLVNKTLTTPANSQGVANNTRPEYSEPPKESKFLYKR